MRHVIYHANCYDGFGSAYAAWKKFGYSDVVYQAAKYGDPPPTPDYKTDVLICDFCFPREDLDRIAKNARSLIVLDHHKTSEALCVDFANAIFDMNKSGAVLTWEYLFQSTPLPELLSYIQDRDLWKFALPESKEVAAALQAYPMDFETWDSLRVENLKIEGRAILKFKHQMVSNMCDNAWIQKIGGFEVPVTNATVFFSEVGEELCRRFPGAPFAAYFLDRSDGKRQWGLRSRNGFDVSDVAKKLGGGGHKAAAGFIEARP